MKSYELPLGAVSNDELLDWTEACTFAVANEIRHIGYTPSDFAAADLLRTAHVDCVIDDVSTRQEPDVLGIIMKYKIQIRKKRPSFMPRSPVVEKQDDFPPYQIARIFREFTPRIRHIGADLLVSACIDDFAHRYLQQNKAMKIYGDDIDSPADVSPQEVVSLIEETYPNQLGRLYRQIRTGTLGK